MARPLKQGADWFKHDRDMRHDPKVLALRRRHGIEGYALWVMTLEVLTDSGGFSCRIDDSAPELFAGDFGVPPDRVLEVWDFCVSVGLLQRVDGNLYSARHQERMSELLSRREADANRKAEKYEARRHGRRFSGRRTTPEDSSPAGECTPGLVIRNSPELSGTLEESREEVLDTSSLTRLSSPSLGAAGALNGAAARPEEQDDMKPEPTSPPEPMRPEHVSELEKRAATGDRFALEALRRARHDGRLPHLPHLPAGGSTRADPPIPPSTEKDDAAADWAATDVKEAPRG